MSYIYQQLHLCAFEQRSLPVSVHARRVEKKAVDLIDIQIHVYREAKKTWASIGNPEVRSVSFQTKRCMSTYNRKEKKKSWTTRSREPMKPQYVNKRFWLSNGAIRFPSLPSLVYIIFAQNPLAVSWWLVLIVLAWVGLFYALEAAGILFVPMLDTTVISIVVAALTFFVSFIFANANSRRGKNIANFKSLASAETNFISAFESTIDYDVWRTDPAIPITVHDGSRFMQTNMRVSKVLAEIVWLLISLQAAQRNVLRGGFKPSKLPLEPHLIAEVARMHRISTRYDPLVVLQQMILARYTALVKAGGFLYKEDLPQKDFFKDIVDSLGNVAIDAAAKTPRVYAVFYWFFMAFVVLYLPLWLIPLYPAWFVLVVAPFTVIFFTSAVLLSSRMADIYVSSRNNVWSDFNLVEELRVTSANIDHTYKSIVEKIGIQAFTPQASVDQQSKIDLLTRL